MLTKEYLENRLLQAQMAFFSLFQLGFTEIRLKSAKIVELKQNQVSQKLLSVIIIMAGILTATAAQQTGWEIVALIIFPFFFFPGLIMAVMSPVLTLDFSKGELTLNSKILWLTAMNWSVKSLTSRDIAVFRVKRVIVMPRSGSERWHFKIEISK